MSAVDTKVLDKEISNMSWVRLQCCSITTHQATSLFTAVGEDVSELRVLDLQGNNLSSVESFLFIPTLQFLEGLYFNGTKLTTHQGKTILDGLGNASNLTHLCLNDNISLVDSAKLVKVNHLKAVTVWQTQISTQQIMEILEASMTLTKLNRLHWNHKDLGVRGWFAIDGTAQQWQELQELMSRLTLNFFDAKFMHIPPICEHGMYYVCTPLELDLV